MSLSTFLASEGVPRADAAVFSDPRPFVLVAPSVNGTPRAGQAVTCQLGTFTSRPTGYAVQWTLDRADIAGATGATYTPVDADAGHDLACRVTAANDAGSSDPATSAAVTVLQSPPRSQSRPTIESKLAVGDTAHCDHGTWTGNPTSYAYRWTRDTVAIAGATAATYTTTADDAGKALRCLVTAHNAGGDGGPVGSDPTTIPAPPPPTTTTGSTPPPPSADGRPVNRTRPTVTRPPITVKKPGTKLVCNPGAWDNADPAAYEYQWQVGGATVGADKTNTLTLTGNELHYGASFTCSVTANGAGGDATATSDAFVIEGTCVAEGERGGDQKVSTKVDPHGKNLDNGNDPCLQGAGLQPPSQAEPIDTRLPLACGTQGGFLYLRVKGCFTTDGKKQTFKGNFSMNGLDFKPVLSDTTVTFDSTAFKESLGKGVTGSDRFAGKVTSSGGAVEVYAGPVLVYKGFITWKVPQEAGSGEFLLASFDPPADTDIEGFPIKPGAPGSDHAKNEGIDLTVTHDYQAKLDMDVDLPFEIAVFRDLLDVNDLSATAQLVTNPDEGLTSNSVKVHKDDLRLGPVDLHPVELSYSQVEDLWTATVGVTLPVPNSPYVKASVLFQHGTFKGVYVSGEHLGIPVFPLVFVDGLRAHLLLNPLELGGGATIDIGKPVDDVFPATVDADLSYRWASDTEPSRFSATGSLALFGVPIESGYLDYYGDHFLDFGLQMGIGLPDFKSDEPRNQPLYIGGGVDGWVQWPNFSVAGHIGVDIVPLHISADADVVVSSKAIAGCVSLFFVNAGAAYTWKTHDIDLFAFSCDVGPYTAPRPPGHHQTAHAAAVGAQQLALPDGGALLKLTGTTDAPKPVVTGPGGQRYVAQADATHNQANSNVVIIEDTKDKTTYVGLHRSKGDWTLTPQAGTSAITIVRTAALLPTPKVATMVSGKGAKRQLRYQVTPAVKGQRLQIVEHNKEGSHLLLNTTRSSGTVSFTPAPGRGGTRTLQATVLNAAGMPRKAMTVGRYVAPTRPVMGAVRKVTAKLKGTTLTVRWPKVAGADTYAVSLKGTRLSAGQYARRHKATVRFPNLVPGRPAGATVTVMAIGADGSRGAKKAVRVKLKAH